MNNRPHCPSFPDGRALNKKRRGDIWTGSTPLTPERDILYSGSLYPFTLMQK